MLRPRIIVGLWAVSLVITVLVSACTGSDSDSEPAPAAAAAQSLTVSEIEVSSSEFTETRPRKRIPPKYTCQGDDLSPPLEWSGVPQTARSLALIAEDPDHSTGTWVHWVLYNIPSTATGLPEALTTDTAVLPDGTVQGVNDYKNTRYNGPCPLARMTIVPRYNEQGIDGPHRYIFKLYALDSELDLAPGATKAELLSAMDGHILGEGETVGKYAPPAVYDANAYGEQGTEEVKTAIAQGTPFGEGGAY